jgi:hypothetical protein
MSKTKLSAAFAALFTAGTAHAQLAAPGDLMFTSFNADEDGWAMVTFQSIAANTTVFFTDNEWNGLAIGAGGAFNTGESYHRWVSGPAVINPGTVIRFSAIDHATNLAASFGTLSRETVAGSTNYGISQSADTIYAYLGSNATTPTVFLGAITSGALNATDGVITNTGLVLNTSATQTSPASDYAEYNGIRSGLASFAAYQPLVANIANWTDLGDGSYAALVPNTTAFTILPVPEVDPLLMLALGLPVLGASIRLRKGRATA